MLRPLLANINAGINLFCFLAAAKMVWLSRFYLLLDDLARQDLTRTLLKRVTQPLLDLYKCKNDDASISVPGDLLLFRISLNSNQFCWKGYPLHIHAKLNNTFPVSLNAETLYWPTSPASALRCCQTSALQLKNHFTRRLDSFAVGGGEIKFRDAMW